ncbi:hypothetical protein ABBQ38_001014 [Trebouxia sp. C0009 RCD-2024]
MQNGVHRPQAPRRFLTYLPQDNDGLANAQSENVLRAINDDLAELLSSPDADFWEVLATEGSLISCLDSFLRFARVNTAGSHVSSQRAQLLYDKWVLDVPKLLDLAAIYGPDNAVLVQQLMQQVFKVQPEYARDLWDTGPALATNLQDVEQTCKQAAEGLSKDSSNAQLLSGLSDGVQYLRDMCITLCYFLQAYPPGSQLLLQGQATIITHLTSLHDDLIPRLAKCGTAGAQHHRPKAEQVLTSLRHLHASTQKLVHLLVSQACLQQHAPPEVSKPPWAGKSTPPFSPAGRGELLMAAVMALAQPSHYTQGPATLLNTLLSGFALAVAAQSAISKGIVQIDVDQQDYLGVLLGDPTGFGSSAGSQALQAAPANTGEDSQQALRGYIAPIKDVLPDFGDGFLAAALQHFSYNSEQVIHALLEGALPPELKALDPHMPLQTPSQQPAGSRKADPRDSGKGKAPMSEARWSDLAVAAAAADKPSSGSSDPILTGPQAARRAAHKATSRILDTRTDAERAAQLQFADASQWEYEDEYDDSYDDLAPFGNDGVADVEGDGEAGPAQPGGYGRSRGAQPPGLPAGGRPPSGQQQQQQRGAKPSKQWVLDGRVYNYRKEGAVEVRGEGEAQQVLQATADAIHGLGPRGNVPQAPPQQSASAQDDGTQASTHGGETATRGRGSQRGGGQRGGSNSVQRDHRHKDMHKAAVANHHRKDRALRKQGAPA